MSKIILKKNKLRNIIRSVINESFEDEGRASQKTINKWLNATPEEIAKWRPELTRNPTEFADLQRMALRQPYNRTHLAQASRDIEDAWRLRNGLPSLKTWKDPVTGKILRKISSVDAQGNPVFTSKTPEQRRFDHNRLSANAMRKKRMADKENRRGQQIMTNITNMDPDVTFPEIPSDYYDEIVSQLKDEYGDKYIDPFTLKSQYDERKNINEMSKIILKESEIRNYVRSLIREALETEGHASPKTIQRWINATPEEIATWKPEGKQDPSEFAALQRMALRQPYDRTHLAQAARDIEDAWRLHNNLPSLKTWKDPNTGKILRKINAIDADGNPIFGSRTEDERKAAHREVAKVGKRESDAKKKEVRRMEKEAQKAEEERMLQAEREAMAEEDLKQWCQENGIDPTTPQAKEMYAKYVEEAGKKRRYEQGLDEFSADALRRRIAWLQKRIKETENSSNTFDYKLCNSYEYALKDAIRILRQNFGPRRKKLPKKEEEPLGTNLSDEELDAMSKEGKEAAAQDMYGKDSEFMAWCGKFGCDANEQTKAVFDSYMEQYNKWCSSTGRDAADPDTKAMFGEIYDEYTKKQLNGVKNTSLTTPQKNRKTKDEYEDDEIDNEPMYDDDDMRGRNMSKKLGQWDSAYDDEGHFNNDYRYSDWN